MLNHKINRILLLASIPLFFACGSKSSDFESADLASNPLPACPDSPNCVRLTREIAHPVDTVWNAVAGALKEMNPKVIDAKPDLYRLEAVFTVVFFSDDLSVKLEKTQGEKTLLHLRSGSRTGYSDLGVNRRRVKRLLSHFEKRLQVGM